MVSTGCSGGAECLRKQWLVVARYFTAFHCQISISETQNGRMGRKKRNGKKIFKQVGTEQLVGCWLEKHPGYKASKDSKTNICVDLTIT